MCDKGISAAAEKRDKIPSTLDTNLKTHRSNDGSHHLSRLRLSNWLRVLMDYLGRRRNDEARTSLGCPEVIQRELENRASADDPAILSNNQGVSGESRGVCWNESPLNRGEEDDKKSSTTARIIMPFDTIRPDEHLELEYKIPRSRIIKFKIHSNRPVKSYVVDTYGLRDFQSGHKRFRYYGGFPEAQRHQVQELRLPFDGRRWYLIIMNPDKHNPVDVHYEVFY